MKVIAAFLFSILLSLSDADPVVQHIIKGTNAKLGEFPHMVGLRRWEQDIFCGGALISNQHVLTAAHCVFDHEADEITVLLGTNDLLNGGKYFNVQKISISEDYNAEKNVGVAVLKLSRPVEFTQFVKKISLPESDAPDGVTSTLSGYGYQVKDPENGFMSQILQKLPVKIVNQEECTKEMEKFETILPQHICGFTAPLFGACYGDSGSPLIYNESVVGVALSVHPDCAEGYPDVYARVTFYSDFIKRAISQ